MYLTDKNLNYPDNCCSSQLHCESAQFLDIKIKKSWTMITAIVICF